jgi:hypothetical protein
MDTPRLTLGDTIAISAGTYSENLMIQGKRLTPNGAGEKTTVIDGGQRGTAVLGGECGSKDVGGERCCRAVIDTALRPIGVALELGRAPISTGDFLEYVDRGLHAGGTF